MSKRHTVGQKTSKHLPAKPNSPVWSLQNAKAGFSELVVRAQKGRAQLVTKHGHPAVYVVDAAEFERMTGGVAPARRLVDHLLRFPKGDLGDEMFARGALAAREADFG